VSDRIAAISIVVFVALLAVVLRLLGGEGDLWFDEVWTLETLQRLETPTQIFSLYRHHTNHLLNSFVLNLLPPLQPDIVYRLPAIAAAIAALPLFWAFTQRQLGSYSLGACLLFAVSVPVIAFSTEARGFSLLIFGSLVALLVLDANLRDEDWRLIGLYWLACTVAFLAHPSFVVFFSALVVWSLSLDFSARFTRTIEILGKCHLVPAAVGAIVYLRFYQFVPPESLGAPPPFLDLFISAMSLAVGGPELMEAAIGGVSLARLVAGSVVILLVTETYLTLQRGGRYWMLYLGGVFVAPYLWYLSPLVRTDSVAYFLLPTIVLYLALGSFVARLMSFSLLSRTTAALLLGLVCFGSLSGLHLASDSGRGKVRRAFAYMAQSTPAPIVTIAGDDDVGNELFVSFYLHRVEVGKPIVYRAAVEPGAADAEWYLVRRDTLAAQLDHEIVMSGGRPFELKKIFRRMLPAGTNLYVYQRAGE
jgi:hypothetical protein